MVGAAIEENPSNLHLSSLEHALELKLALSLQAGG